MHLEVNLKREEEETMNKVILIGNLVKDVELTEFNGTPVANGTLAVNRPYAKDKVDYIPFTIWGNTAEVVARNNGKGSKLMVEGELQINKSNDKYFTKVNVKEVEFLSPKSAIQRDIMGNPLQDSEVPQITSKELPGHDFDAERKHIEKMKKEIEENDLPF
jgi:single-strand DNA-binding protein